MAKAERDNQLKMIKKFHWKAERKISFPNLKKCHLTILMLTFISVIPLIHAQELTPEKIRVYSTADGLPSSVIFCLDQDKQGNLWIGTPRGASKFDGKAFTNYAAYEGFSDKIVWAVLCDKRGITWFATSGDGLFRFDGKKWARFTEEKDGLPSDNFFNGFLYEDSRGYIFGSPQYGSSLFRYAPRKFDIIGFQIADIVEDQTGNIYAIKSNGAFLYKYSPQKNGFEEIYKQFSRTRNLAIDRNNNIWVATETYLGKSADQGRSFEKFNISKKDVGRCWDLFIDKDNQVWAAYSHVIVRFDGSNFYYYKQENGLPAGSYKYIFQDEQGHLWFCGSGGIGKFDDIPPALEPPKSVLNIVRSQSLSFQFRGDDGKLGTLPENLTHEFKFTDENQWRKAENGQAYIDKLQDKTQYQLQLRVTDGFENRTEKTISFQVQIDAANIPSVEITNREGFKEPVDSSEVRFDFTAQDNETPQEALFFSYKLDKGHWSGWKTVRSAAFRNLKIGEHTFFLKVINQAGNESPVSTLVFMVESPEEKPKIALSKLSHCYFLDKNNRPVSECEPVQQEIMSGRISFSIDPIDPRPEKRILKYSVLLESKMRDWSLYRDDNLYKFHDLSDGQYTLIVRAKDREGFVSAPVQMAFTVKGFDRFPQTHILDETLSRGKVVDKMVHLCCKASTENSLFSYQVDDLGWTPFDAIRCFEFPKLQNGRHVIRVLAKNEFGIDPMPDIYEFDYERIRDLPIIKLLSKPEDIVETRAVRFQFVGEDDMQHGDQTPVDFLRYSHRLIPESPNWSEPTPEQEVAYPDLKNGSYFFQVKAIDKSENESVVPAECFFTVRIIPFYQQQTFVWGAGGSGLLLVAFFSIVLTRMRTKKTIYEQRYNPYIVGEAVHDPEMFFGRADMMQDIFQSLRQNSLCLTGERRIGKTTLLEHINKNAQEPFFSFFCNLESVKEAFFFSRIMQHLVNKVQSVWENTKLDLILLEKERHEYDDLDFEEDVDAVLGFLKKHYNPQVSIIMCLDEIDATEGFSPDIHQSLRNVFQTYQGTIRMVAAGVSIKRGEWHLPTSPWYNFFEFRDISALDRFNAERLITEPVRGFYTYGVGAIDFIPYKTNGKPFYIQMICKKAINRVLDEKRRKVTLADVKIIYDRLIRSELNREFESFWENLSIELQKTIARACEDKETLVPKEYEQELRGNAYNHSHRVIQLQNGKLVFSRLFQDWLKINYGKKEGT
ncbi:MAG: hypothetical protein B6245_16010 [Desulfobacteraceae bacterium 4572_88]|nr:MAG: hypothetical protein B6245_16010 [Desulfobacteraceae bacterium 4572_88]